MPETINLNRFLDPASIGNGFTHFLPCVCRKSATESGSLDTDNAVTAGMAARWRQKHRIANMFT